MEVHRARLAFGRADEEVVQAVAIDVAYGDERPFGGQHLGGERLAVEIHEVVLVVHEVDADGRGHVREDWGDGRERRDGPSDGRPIRLPDRDVLIRADVSRDTPARIGPIDGQRVQRRAVTNAEREDIVHARLKSARWLELLHELALAVVHRHARTGGQPVHAVAQQLYLEVVIIREQ